MKNIKVILIILTILIIICATTLITIMYRYRGVNTRVETEEPDLGMDDTIKDSIENLQYYPYIEKQLINYFYYLSTNNAEAADTICKERSYNIPTVIENIEIKNLYLLDNIVNTVYFLKVAVNENTYNYALLLDGNNYSYNLVELTDTELSQIIKNNIPQEYKEYKQIKNEVYNNHDIADRRIVEFYFNNFKNAIKENTEIAYNFLNEEYKQKRYGSYQNFEKYIKDNYNDFLNMRLYSYDAYTIADGTMHMCKDQNGKPYIFIEKSIMDYKLQLDDYTLENEFFNTTYEKTSNMNKGLLNCERFFEMINTQDYAAAYNVLDESFKQTNFKTQADFETYIKNKLYRYNKARYEEYGNQITSVHTYKINLTDATGANSNQIPFNIVMRLEEGTTFTMSFEVN